MINKIKLFEIPIKSYIKLIGKYNIDLLIKRTNISLIIIKRIGSTTQINDQ